VAVEEGAPAPDFTLMSDAREEVTLSSLRGQPVVLYFYPRDDTTGCTTQACGIRDAYDEFRDRGAIVLGVSIDDVDSHTAFKEKHSLPFTLLADPDKIAGEAYGVTQEDRETLRRSTFVIGADGTVKRALPQVDPATHADEVLAALDAA
jgi:peroxiredoxin Q/BCP